MDLFRRCIWYILIYTGVLHILKGCLYFFGRLGGFFLLHYVLFGGSLFMGFHTHMPRLRLYIFLSLFIFLFLWCVFGLLGLLRLFWFNTLLGFLLLFTLPLVFHLFLSLLSTLILLLLILLLLSLLDLFGFLSFLFVFIVLLLLLVVICIIICLRILCLHLFRFLVLLVLVMAAFAFLWIHYLCCAIIKFNKLIKITDLLLFLHLSINSYK